MAKVSHIKGWEPVGSSIAYWKWFSRLCEIWWTRGAGTEAVDAARRDRFHALVQFARSHSPFYRDTAIHWPPSTRLMAVHLEPLRFATQYVWDLLAGGGPLWLPRRASISPALPHGSACVKAARGLRRAAFPSWNRYRGWLRR